MSALFLHYEAGCDSPFQHPGNNKGVHSELEETY